MTVQYVGNKKILWKIVINKTLLGQTKSCIARNFPRLIIEYIFNNKSCLTTISCDASATAVIQSQV